MMKRLILVVFIVVFMITTCYMNSAFINTKLEDIENALIMAENELDDHDFDKSEMWVSRAINILEENEFIFHMFTNNEVIEDLSNSLVCLKVYSKNNVSDFKKEFALSKNLMTEIIDNENIKFKGVL